MRFQRVDDRRVRCVSGGDDPSDSILTKGSGGYRTDGGDGDSVLQLGHCLFPYQVGQVMDSAWAEENRSIGSLPDYLRHAISIDIAGGKCAIGDDFGHFCAKLF